MIRRDEVIVLKGQNWSETSRIVHALARHGGRIKLVAKGARRPKSRFGAAFEPGTLAQVVYYDSRRSDLHTASEAAVLWRPRHDDLERLALRAAGLELADKGAPPETPSFALYANLLRFLQSLDDEGGAKHAQLIAFLLLAMNNLGYNPVLDRCLSCGKPAGQHVHDFSVSHGGFVCAACGRKQTETVAVTAAQYRALRLWHDHQALPDLAPDDSLRMINILTAFLNHHIPGRNKLICARYLV
ncbi:MAG TPA: DNA repair protein RecO [Candidatus Edwardsbacteria bacterium]|nr:DNA repair protein RecO [Candidatus Edwardsbacteria bacterium]